MAFSTFRFDEFSIRQIQDILEQRDRTGFHTYYDDGFDQKYFFCITPWYMRDGCIITLVFRYPSKKTGDLTEDSQINLGRYNRHISDRISLLFEKQNAIVLRYIRGEDVKDKLQLADKNVRGFHVIQFIRGPEELTIFFDGKLATFPNLKVKDDDIADYVVLYTDEGRPKFSMVETHFTMNDTTMIRKDPAYFNSTGEYFFFQDNVVLGVGGYALWNGKWKPGTKVSAIDKNSANFAGEVVVPPSGIMLAMLKVYPSGIAFLDARDTRKTPAISSKYRDAGLKNLYIQPNPDTLKEFIAVTGGQ